MCVLVQDHSHGPGVGQGLWMWGQVFRMYLPVVHCSIPGHLQTSSTTHTLQLKGGGIHTYFIDLFREILTNQDGKVCFDFRTAPEILNIETALAKKIEFGRKEI